MEKEYFTILQVANMLEITTQAVYKRLQQDEDKLGEHLKTVKNKKSLSKEGVEVLADLMQLQNPFNKEKKEQTNNKQELSTENIDLEDNSKLKAEFVNYLKNDNQRLRDEVEYLKTQLEQTRALREQDKQIAVEERREYEEARKRTDTLLLKSMISIEENRKPSLMDRIFRRGKKHKQANFSDQD